MNEEREVDDLAEHALRYFYLQEMSIRNLSFQDSPEISFEEWKATKKRWEEEHESSQE